MKFTCPHCLSHPQQPVVSLLVVKFVSPNMVLPDPHDRPPLGDRYVFICSRESCVYSEIYTLEDLARVKALLLRRAKEGEDG